MLKCSAEGCIILIEFSYLISFILGILSKTLVPIDIFNCFILYIIYIYYLTIVFSYFIIILIKNCINCKPKDEEKLPDINLMSYIAKPSKKEYKGVHFYHLSLLLEIKIFTIIICYGVIFRKIKEGLLYLSLYFSLGFIFRFKFPLYFGKEDNVILCNGRRWIIGSPDILYDFIKEN